jgi:hypothetical protein
MTEFTMLTSISVLAGSFLAWLCSPRPVPLDVVAATAVLIVMIVERIG